MSEDQNKCFVCSDIILTIMSNNMLLKGVKRLVEMQNKLISYIQQQLNSINFRGSPLPVRPTFLRHIKHRFFLGLGGSGAFEISLSPECEVNTALWFSTEKKQKKKNKRNSQLSTTEENVKSVLFQQAKWQTEK